MNCPIHRTTPFRIECGHTTGFCLLCLRHYALCTTNRYMQPCERLAGHKLPHRDHEGYTWAEGHDEKSGFPFFFCDRGCRVNVYHESKRSSCCGIAYRKDDFGDWVHDENPPVVLYGPDIQPDFSKKCSACGGVPVMPITGMCGPCTTGEGRTAGGNW